MEPEKGESLEDFQTSLFYDSFINPKVGREYPFRPLVCVEDICQGHRAVQTVELVKLFSRIAGYSLPLRSIYSLMAVSGFCVEFRLHLV